VGHIEKSKELYDKIKGSPRNTKYSDLCKLAKMVGYIYDRHNGDHEIYKHPEYTMMNFQNVKGKAKPYQIKQLLDIISENNLLKEGK